MCLVMGGLVIDLFCGLGGWSKGFLAEGFDCIGFDIQRHEYAGNRYPAQLVLQDVRTLHGSQFRDAAAIVASPPCQEYSYMAMPWARAKAIARALRGKGEFPDGYSGSRTVEELRALFDICFRIQRQACESAGRYVPMFVENVRGAQPWVGRARANYGSFYLWGDIESVGPSVVVTVERCSRFGETLKPRRTAKMSSYHLYWDGAPHSKHLTNSLESAAVPGVKVSGDWFGRGENCSPQRMREADYLNWLCATGIKQPGLSGPAWFDNGAAAHGSTSHARKAASAQIAEIPFELSRFIARSLHS